MSSKSKSGSGSGSGARIVACGKDSTCVKIASNMDLAKAAGAAALVPFVLAAVMLMFAKSCPPKGSSEEPPSGVFGSVGADFLAGLIFAGLTAGIFYGGLKYLNDKRADGSSSSGSKKK